MKRLCSIVGFIFLLLASKLRVCWCMISNSELNFLCPILNLRRLLMNRCIKASHLTVVSST